MNIKKMRYYDFIKTLNAIPSDHCRQVNFREFLIEILKKERKKERKNDYRFRMWNRTIL